MHQQGRTTNTVAQEEKSANSWLRSKKSLVSDSSLFLSWTNILGHLQLYSAVTTCYSAGSQDIDFTAMRGNVETEPFNIHGLTLVSEPACSRELVYKIHAYSPKNSVFGHGPAYDAMKLKHKLDAEKSTLMNLFLPLCFPSRNWAFLDDLNVSKNSLPFCSSTFLLALSHLCSEAKISTIRGNALPAASVSRKASRHLLATKSTADSQYS